MPSSLLNVRRGLYEAVLLAEQHGAVVVERDLPLEDMALSANTAACLWTETHLEQVRSGSQMTALTCCQWTSAVQGYTRSRAGHK